MSSTQQFWPVKPLSGWVHGYKHVKQNHHGRGGHRPLPYPPPAQTEIPISPSLSVATTERPSPFARRKTKRRRPLASHRAIVYLSAPDPQQRRRRRAAHGASSDKRTGQVRCRCFQVDCSFASPLAHPLWARVRGRSYALRWTARSCRRRHARGHRTTGCWCRRWWSAVPRAAAPSRGAISRRAALRSFAGVESPGAVVKADAELQQREGRTAVYCIWAGQRVYCILHYQTVVQREVTERWNSVRDLVLQRIKPKGDLGGAVGITQTLQGLVS